MATGSLPPLAPGLRYAGADDVAALEVLIVESVRELHRADYSAAQIELALASVYGVDRALIADGTYYVVEDGLQIVASGGWSKRATLCGGDQFAGRVDGVLDPTVDAAKIRAFYVRPTHVRRGLASLVLTACEREARAAGFRRAELGATLTGVSFYAAHGYAQVGRADVPLDNGEQLAVVRMERCLI